LDLPSQEELLRPREVALSVVIPTYNESHNIARLLDSIAESIPAGLSSEIIVVDDSSPDGTADLANGHAKFITNSKTRVLVIRRASKLGLGSAILAGVRSASGEMVVVIDGDFSHPPQTIPNMIRELRSEKYDIVIASRYIEGGAIIGWPFRRKLMSKGATKIAQYGLGVDVKDPMSGFFAFRRQIINDVKFDAIGYKMLLEILVKAKGVRVGEIPYSFTNRQAGASKVDTRVIYDYLRAVYRLYRYGRISGAREQRTSVRFLSKAGRFYTVGASGLLVNYAVSFLFGMSLPGLWYLYGTVIGILFSIISNFFLNKFWTFEDRDFGVKKTAVQCGKFMGFSSLGALMQLSIVYWLVEGSHASYPVALVIAVAATSISNFLLNKKWTFKENIWS
jgi:dolichol-phosphate mannosyltransferase